MAGLYHNPPEMNMRRATSGLIYALSGAIGVLAFAYPFFLAGQANGPIGIAHGQDAALVTTALVGLSLVALLVVSCWLLVTLLVADGTGYQRQWWQGQGRVVGGRVMILLGGVPNLALIPS
mgnify:CR=1 FL=1